MSHEKDTTDASNLEVECNSKASNMNSSSDDSASRNAAITKVTESVFDNSHCERDSVDSAALHTGIGNDKGGQGKRLHGSTTAGPLYESLKYDSDSVIADNSPTTAHSSNEDTGRGKNEANMDEPAALKGSESQTSEISQLTSSAGTI